MTKSIRRVEKKPPEERNIYFSKVVDKGLRILELFRPEITSLCLKDIAAATGINRTSAFRFIDTLVQLGYLRKDPQTKLIKLGPKALNLGQNIICSFDILQIVQPLIEEVFRKFDVTIDSAILDDVTLVRLFRKEAVGSMVFKLPQVIPPAQLYCTALGKACLSALPKEAYKRAVSLLIFEQRTSTSIPNMKALEADLEDTRRRGFSINNEEYIGGVVSLGAPIFSADKGILGAISFDVLSVECSKSEAVSRYAPAVVQLAKVISSSLS